MEREQRGREERKAEEPKADFAPREKKTHGNVSAVQQQSQCFNRLRSERSH